MISPPGCPTRPPAWSPGPPRSSEKHSPATRCRAGAKVRWASKTSLAQKNPLEKQAGVGAPAMEEGCSEAPGFRPCYVRIPQTAIRHNPWGQED